MPDPHLKKVREHWESITGMYRLFEHKNPIIEFDIQRLHILAYPAADYLNRLTERTREQTWSQYRQATAEGALMVFVRDESLRVFRSYIFPLDNDETKRIDGQSAK